MARKWKLITRHKYADAKISEYYNIEDCAIRRFTATICGFRNFHIYEGRVNSETIKQILSRVQFIRDKIEQGKEVIFYIDVSLNKKPDLENDQCLA